MSQIVLNIGERTCEGSLPIPARSKLSRLMKYYQMEF